MQVTHPAASDIGELKALWKEIFQDTDLYIELFFQKKFSPENTFLMKENGHVASMLYFFPTRFRFRDRTIPVAYICGVATRAECRGKGYSRQILKTAVESIRMRGYKAAFLIPASASLFEFYQKAAGFQPYFYLERREMEKREAPKELQREIPFSSERFSAFYERLNHGNQFFCVKDAKDFEDLFSFYHPEGSQFHLFEDGYLIFHTSNGILYVTESYFETQDSRDKAIQYFMAKNNCEKAVITSPSSGRQASPYASLLILDDNLKDIIQVENNYVNLMFN